jgi:hypothetical protein
MQDETGGLGVAGAGGKNKLPVKTTFTAAGGGPALPSPSSGGGGGGDDKGGGAPAAKDPYLEYLATINANYLNSLRNTPGSMSATNKYLTPGASEWEQYLAASSGEGQKLFGYGGIQDVTPGNEFNSDPGIAGWHIVPPTTASPNTDWYQPSYSDPMNWGGGGGGGGGGGNGGNGGWFDYSIEGAPEGWIGKGRTGDERYLVGSLLNNLMANSSKVDREYLAQVLSRMYPEGENPFAAYNPVNLPAGFYGTETLNPEMENYYLGDERATRVMSALTAMQKASGVGEEQWGPGYSWLMRMANTMQDYGDYGATTSITNQQRAEMMARLDPLLAEGKNENLSPYAEIGRMLTQPFFTNAPFNARSTTPTGIQFGNRNPTLF